MSGGKNGKEPWKGVGAWALIESAMTNVWVEAWYVMLGITCAQMTILYFSHKALIHDVMDKAPLVIEKLSQVRSKNPELWNRLMLQAARELLVSLPSGVSIEDVAFFLGRVIRGSAAAAPALSLKVLAKIVATTAPLVAVTHLPSMTGHVLNAEAKKRVTAPPGTSHLVP